MFLATLHIFVLNLPLLHAETFDINEAWRQLIENVEELNNTAHKKFEANPAADVFLLYTRRNRLVGQVLKYNDAESVTSSNFNPNVPTMVIAHGWLENKNSEINPTLTSVLLKHGDVNVIVLDWSRFSRMDYSTAVWGVPSVGRGLGQFLAFLNQITGMSYELVHLIGFSLGGHVVGNAGRELKGQVARITALDPAGPMWYRNDERLRNTDARYVEAIHTNGGALGIEFPVGHADFYPNGGSSQPGCSPGNVACSHYRSYHLFAATLNRNHLVGRQCSNTIELIINFCRGKSYPMGNSEVTKFGTGIYRLTTGSVYPYYSLSMVNIHK